MFGSGYVEDELNQEIAELINTVNELKNTIERQEILIDKMKRCENCKYDYPGTGEDFDDICHRCEDGSEWELYNE